MPGYETCERCGVSNYSATLETHHVVGRVGPDKDKPQNLVKLCNKCHWKWHNHRDQDFENWMYRYMKSIYGNEFPVKVSGMPKITKWIRRVESDIEKGLVNGPRQSITE